MKTSSADFLSFPSKGSNRSFWDTIPVHPTCGNAEKLNALIQHKHYAGG